MKRAVSVYGALLLSFLGLAWAEWTAPPKEDTGDKIPLLQGTTDDLEKIRYKAEKEDVVLERRSDARGPYLWVTYTKWETPKGDKPEVPPDPHAPPESEPPAPPDPAAAPAEAPAEASPPAPEERTAKVQIFKAGEAGDKLLDSLSPLLAIRRLDAVPPEKLAAIGLDSPKEELEVVRKGRSRVFDVGGEAYGTKDRYLRDRESGEIFLVDDEVLRPLKYARTRLPDRSLSSITREKVASAVISSGVASVEVLQKNADDKDKATWVRASAPDAAAEQLKTWMDKALQLKSTSYVEEADMPATLDSRFKLRLNGPEGLSETIEVLQSGPDGDWYARSEHTRGLVKLIRGPTSALAEDVDDLVSAD